MTRSDFKPSEVFNLIHDTKLSPVAIPYREVHTINGKLTDVGGKACNVLEGCGETIHNLYQIRPELKEVTDDNSFHVCDICTNCGTLFAIV